MGKRGPAPTPTKVLQMRGSWRAKTRNGEPQPAAKPPSCPKWLDGKGQYLFRALVAELMPLGLVTKLDAQALARYCQMWSQWREALAYVTDHGSTYPILDAEGGLKSYGEFPQVRQLLKLNEALLKIEREFGLTPSARARLARPESSDDDPQETGKARFFRS